MTDAVTLVRHAVDHGCGGVLMLPPFYYKGVSDDGIFAFVYHLGSLWMVALLAVVALLRRNVVLALTFAASGLVAAGVAHLLVSWLDTESSTLRIASTAA